MNLDFEAMPVRCDCGEWFDLLDGNGCGTCKKVFCCNCVKEPFDLCENCQSEEDYFRSVRENDKR